MGEDSYREISNQLSFSMVDVPVLVDILKSLNNCIKTTDDVIHYWDMCCFRADTIDEIIEQFDDVEDIKDIGDRVFILPTKTLIVIGFATLN